MKLGHTCRVLDVIDSKYLILNAMEHAPLSYDSLKTQKNILLCLKKI